MGKHYFATAVLLRESLFLNGILTNAEIWYGMSKSDIKELENLDHTLLRKILKTPYSTPVESMYLELGLLNIETILMARRINYLQYLTKRKKSEMLSKFFIAQWNHPAPTGDWTEEVKNNLLAFGMEIDLEKIEAMSKFTFKSLVKRKAKEFALINFMEQMFTHSKMTNLWYTDLKMQDYLKCDEMNPAQAMSVYSYRTRMAVYSDNYKGQGGVGTCPLCHLHLDVQSLSFQCIEVRKNVKICGKYEDIFGDRISSELAKTVYDMSILRKKFLEERTVENLP